MPRPIDTSTYSKTVKGRLYTAGHTSRTMAIINLKVAQKSAEFTTLLHTTTSDMLRHVTCSTSRLSPFAQSAIKQQVPLFLIFLGMLGLVWLGMHRTLTTAKERSEKSGAIADHGPQTEWYLSP